MKITIEPRPYLMINQIKNYSWGEPGETAFIPKLIGEKADPDKKYSELWMGAHPKSPSTIQIGNEQVGLDKLALKFRKEILGEADNKFNGNFPFLFKVLTAGEPLSIQAHPCKKLAAELHKRDPQNYPDANHKPEIAIALGPFSGLVGFKTLSHLKLTLQKYYEIVEFVGVELFQNLKKCNEANSPESKKALKDFYSSLIYKSIEQPDELNSAIDLLFERLENQSCALTDEEQLFMDLRKIYTGADVGLFSLFLLNLAHFKTGQAVFLDTDIPHAYVKGNIIECMANSDNVVRAGLTPKYQDEETLVNMLTYEMKEVPIIEADSKLDEFVYTTSAPDFEVSRLKLNDNQPKNCFASNKPEILLLIEGQISIYWGNNEEHAEEFYKGQSIFIPACLERYKLIADSECILYKASVP